MLAVPEEGPEVLILATVAVMAAAAEANPVEMGVVAAVPLAMMEMAAAAVLEAILVRVLAEEEVVGAKDMVAVALEY